jgi:hypothetical protein
MEGTINKHNWWLVLVVGGVLAIAVTLIQQKWMPEYDLIAFLIAMVILAAAFYWVYTVDKKAFWWAQIPALCMIAILAAGIVGYLTPKDASNSSPWAVVTLGLGAAVIGFVLKRPTVKFVFYAIGIITLLVGILMLPLTLGWKIALIVVEAVGFGYLAWQALSRPAKT